MQIFGILNELCSSDKTVYKIFVQLCAVTRDLLVFLVLLVFF